MGGVKWKPLFLLTILQTFTFSEARWRQAVYGNEPLQYPITSEINSNAIKVLKTDDSLKSQVKRLENIVLEFIGKPDNIVDRLSDSVEKLELILQPFYRQATHSFRPQLSRRSTSSSTSVDNSTSLEGGEQSIDEIDHKRKKAKKRKSKKNKQRKRKRKAGYKDKKKQTDKESVKRKKSLTRKTRGTKLSKPQNEGSDKRKAKKLTRGSTFGKPSQGEQEPLISKPKGDDKRNGKRKSNKLTRGSSFGKPKSPEQEPLINRPKGSYKQSSKRKNNKLTRGSTSEKSKPQGKQLLKKTKRNDEDKSKAISIKKGKTVYKYRGKVGKVEVTETKRGTKKEKVKEKEEKRLAKQNGKVRKLKKYEESELDDESSEEKKGTQMKKIGEKNTKLDKDKKEENQLYDNIFRSARVKKSSKRQNKSNKKRKKSEKRKNKKRKSYSYDESSEEELERGDEEEISGTINSELEEPDEGSDEDEIYEEETKIQHGKKSPKESVADPAAGGTSVAVSAGEGASVTVSASRRALMKAIDRKYWPKMYLQEYEKYQRQKKKLRELNKMFDGSNVEESDMSYYRRINGKNRRRKKSRKLRRNPKKGSASVSTSAGKDGVSVSVSASRRNYQ